MVRILAVVLHLCAALGISAVAPPQSVLAHSGSRPGDAWHKGVRWTAASFPSPIEDPKRCNRGIASHVCDPENLIPSNYVDLLDHRLENLAAASHTEVCPSKGWQVYVAVLQGMDEVFLSKFSTLDEAFHAFATSLGHQWGVFGGKCQNAVVVVYSVSNEYMVVQPDEGAGARLEFPPDLIKHVARSALRGFRGSPYEAVAIAVDKLSAIVDGNLNVQTLAIDRATIFIYVLVTCFGFTGAILSLCCVYDTVLHCRHQARFRRCYKKIERIHNVFMQRPGEMPLCCACVDFLPHKPSDGRAAPNVVVFLCGHRLHTDCANAMFARAGTSSTQCPMCTLPDQPASDGSNDDAKSFFLHSLQKEFPDIITQYQVGRWRLAHTEIWLSELEQPRYKSIWKPEGSS